MDSHKTQDAQRGSAHVEPELSTRETAASGSGSEVAPVPFAETSVKEEVATKEKAGSGARKKTIKNSVRKIRMEKMMSKAELARRAGMSTLTIDRVERGMPCRMDTKRKILEALGLKPSDRVMVFGEDD
jgi:DNA-binding XRE family transcriptional regulator